MNKKLLTESSVQVDPRTITLEGLRFKRAESLIKLELCKAQLTNEALRAKQQVKSQGVRGLLFNEVVRKRLHVADYVLLGLKGGQMLMRLFKRRKK